MKLNTNLFPIISVGMYYTALSPDSIFDDYQINEDFESGEIKYGSEYFWDNFDNSKYVAKIESIATHFLDGTHEADGIKIDIKVGKIYSPSYYNFATDQIDLDVDYNKDQLLAYAEENMDNFNEYLKENYSSYDGFNSFTANNYSDWVEDFKNDNEQSVGAVLTYLFRDEEMQDQFMNEVYNSEVYYWDFVDDSEYNKVYDELALYVSDNYPNLDRDICPVEHDDIDVMSIYKDLINKIESNTLTLEL